MDRYTQMSTVIPWLQYSRWDNYNHDVYWSRSTLQRSWFNAAPVFHHSSAALIGETILMIDELTPEHEALLTEMRREIRGS